MDHDEDSFPNFGNAFPSTMTTSGAEASWHPALRPDNDTVAQEDDDFFERYPGATPKKKQAVETAAEAEEPESPVRRQSISVQHVVDVQKSDATPDELQNLPANHVEVQGPASRSMDDVDEEAEAGQHDDERAILEPGDSAMEQEQALEEHMPESHPVLEATREADGGEEQGMYNEGDADGDVISPSQHYEHQGEITEMEEAIEPSAQASLIQNEEPLPTPGNISREPTWATPDTEDAFGFDGAQEPSRSLPKASAVPSHLQRSFTTNFSDSDFAPQEEQPPVQQHSTSSDWPSVGDDKTFGELLDRQKPHSMVRDASEGKAQEPQQVSELDDGFLPEEEGDIKEEDLAAAWGAAVDDDELLEETPTDLDPSQFFGSEDDDGFLQDEPAPAPVQQPQQQRSAPANQYRPANIQQKPQQQQYGVPNPQFFEQSSHGRSAGTPSTGLYDIYSHNAPVQQQQQTPQQRPGIKQAQSFVDKAKGGYESPYDLPMDVVQPTRRRPQQPMRQPSGAQGSNAAAPPPRSSSFGSGGQPPPARTSSVSSLSPPQSSYQAGAAAHPAAAPATPAALPRSTSSTGSGFFEDLPVAPKPRARPSGNQYTPQQPPGPRTPGAMPPPQLPPSRSSTGPAQPNYFPLQASAAPAAPVPQQQPPNGGSAGFGGLRQPDRMPLLPEQPAQPMQAPQAPSQNIRYSPSSQVGGTLPAPQAPPAVQNRYSPAPAATATTQPPAASRYSPAPTQQPIGAQPPLKRHTSAAGIPGVQNAHPFAPRTSSPLAAMNIDKPHPPLPQEPSRESLPSSPPKVNGRQTSLSLSPESRPSSSRYAPSNFVEPPMTFAPPQRPRTQSPDATMKGPKQARPSSSAANPQPAHGAVLHRRQFSREYTFAPPQDERSQDPLERWKGHPIFKWSASGTVLSSFAKQMPFYAAGQGMPLVKCTPGPITVQDATAFMPMDDRNAKFPGPLTARSKGKKKDVMAWLVGKIEDLERSTEGAMLDFALPADLKKRAEEKLVLWKIMRIFIEHDGVMEGNPKIDEEVRQVLLPNLSQMAQVADLQSPASADMVPNYVDKSILFQLRQALLEGQRERAVWIAEEKKLWGHAMLIASTMGPETWKQIIQAFVRSQVKSVGSDARSMAALYQVFAGNSEECVDELVPPSARAGFSMISRSDGSVSGNPLEGLDQWKETLGLITSNRTASDGPSLISLGKLLSSYGRVEAAHTCFLFARQFAKHSGSDDADAHFVLLGADHQAQDANFGNDLDSILLTEVYEYAASLSAPSTAVNYIPHLQAFKLMHANQLAAYGQKTKAQAYCHHITSAYTSTTRPSGYYHPTFTQSVADFSAFLSQTPQDGKGTGMLSRPAMNKVSSSAASWFSKFVAGEDDQESTGSGPASGSEAAGPFGRVNGESPGDLSRTNSTTDLYNPMMSGGGMPIPGVSPASGLQPAFAPSSAPGRYAPGGAAKYAPAQPYSGLGMPAAEPQRPSSARYAPAPSSLGVPRPDFARRGSEQSLPYAPSSRRGSAQDTSSVGSYEPRPILADESSTYSYSPPVTSPLAQAQHAPAVQEPDVEDAPNGILEPAVDDAEGGSAGYEPPTGGYEPPSYTYTPYEPEPDSPEDAKPKPKRFGDEDEDDGMAQQGAALKKAQADKAADEAFRKAAEADAARDKNDSGGKKGWLGGWFGGKKDPNLAQTPGPIKAKLGEENSFYYDENLKKWVNKKGGSESSTPAAATPPPPKGPVGRVTSASSMGPPSGPPSRASSGMGPPPAPTSRPPTSASGQAFSSGHSSGPPSRVATPSSEAGGNVPASAVPMNGDLNPGLAPAVRPGSSLSTASSIDDLLAGPPGARKGGTLKGKKKGGRYVDVMAK